MPEPREPQAIALDRNIVDSELDAVLRGCEAYMRYNQASLQVLVSSELLITVSITQLV